MKPKPIRNPRSKSELAKDHAKRKGMAKSKTKTRVVRSFHPNTISIPEDETIGVFEGKVVYTDVIDAVTGESLGTPDMEIVKSTMRPAAGDERSTFEGMFYIANFRREA